MILIIFILTAINAIATVLIATSLKTIINIIQIKLANLEAILTRKEPFPKDMEKKVSRTYYEDGLY